MSALEQAAPIAEAPPLLEASIFAGDRNTFSVSLRSGSGPVSEDTYVRFALHYYARVLYEMAHGRQTLRNLPAEIEAIVCSPLRPDANAFALAGLRGCLRTSVEPTVGYVHLTFRHCVRRRFDLDGEIGLSGRPLARSMIALLQAIVPMLSADALARLCTGLANMNASYAMTHKFAARESLHEVPDIAYLASAFL